jgi:N-acetylmuramoyl-L-alanine amidase
VLRNRLAGFLALLLLAGPAAAQLPLSVNGWQVDGLRLDLLQNISYAPAVALAEAFGAELVIDHAAGFVTLRMGGRTVQLRIRTAETASEPGSFTLNAAVRDEPGAIMANELFLPVKALAHAFGGYVTQLSGAQPGVVVVLPRGVLQELASHREAGSERIVVSLSSAVPYTVYFNEPLSTLQIPFDRTENATRTTLEGSLFRHASVTGDRGAAELRILLEGDIRYTLHSVPQGSGYQLVVQLSERREVPAHAVSPWRVVLDPGPAPAAGQADQGLVLAEMVARELEREGLDVQLTRSADLTPTLAGRTASGGGADLFLSLSVNEKAAEQYALYFLGDAQGSELLEQAIRLNAEAALPDTSEQVRRQVLLGLIPDLAAGRRLADALQGELYSRADWQGAVREAPLRVLVGAGGRGVLLELNGAAAADPGLPALLAAGIRNALRGR